MNPRILASQLADDYIHQCCLDRFIAQLDNSLYKSIQQVVGKDTTEQPEQSEPPDSYPHAEFFTALFKALEPYEKQWAAMLQGIWGEEEKIMVANLKKLKKAYMSKDDSGIVDSVMYPKGMFEDKLSAKARTIDLLILSKQGALEMERIGVTDIAFNVENPEVQKWLKEYVPKFSKKLEDVSVERLRRELLAGLKAGEGIPELTRRVNTTYAHWNKVRSEMIARTEASRASNRAALEAYRQSGVVKKKQWVTHFDKRTCFPGNIKIITNQGEKKIRNIKKGDIVLTHKGWQKVNEIMNRKYYGKLLKIKTSDGKELIATEDHPVYEVNKGWVEINNLVKGNKLKTSKNKAVNVIGIYNIKFFNSYNFISKIFKELISSSIFNWIRMPIFPINFKANIDHWKEKIHATFSSFSNTKLFYLIFLDKINPKFFKCLPNCFFNRGFSRIFTIARKGTEFFNIFHRRNYSKFFTTIKTFNINGWSSAFFRTIFSAISLFISFSKNLSTSKTGFINNEFCFTDITTKNISLPHRFINSKRLFASRAYFSNLFKSLSTYSGTKIFIDSTMPTVKSFSALFAYFKFPSSCRFVITFRRAIERIMVRLNLIFRNKLFSATFTYIHNRYKYFINSIKISQPHIVYNLDVENAHTYFANGILVHNCSWCEQMDGKIVGIETAFFNQGDEFTISADGKDQTMKLDYEEVVSPPLHSLCRCVIVAYFE